MPGREPYIVPVQNFEVNLHNVLGEGGFGKVLSAKDNSSRPPVACAAKRITLTKADESAQREALSAEVKMLDVVKGHPYVISLLGHAVTGVLVGPEEDTYGRSSLIGCAWVMLELADGGELFDRLIDSRQLSERATRVYIRGIVSGLKHCLSKGVVHRDLKLENVMLSATNAYAVKLVDFGLAVRIPQLPDGSIERTIFKEQVGTKSYRAPESYAGDHEAPPLDVWALGIILFTLVAGFFPLDQAQNKDWRFVRLAQDLAQKISACDSIFRMYSRPCPFSPALKSLLDSMLCINPAERITLAKIAEDPWLLQPDQEGAGYDDDDDDEGRAVYRGDALLYRGLGGAGDDLPFELPADAIPVSRQCAQRF